MAPPETLPTAAPSKFESADVIAWIFNAVLIGLGAIAVAAAFL